jgi:Tol biopolymer transport system component
MGVRTIAALATTAAIAVAPAAGATANGKIAFSTVIGVYTVVPDGAGVTAVGHGHAPAFSPDGSRLAYIDGGDPSELWVVGADGSTSVQISADRPVLHFAWSPDGTRLAVVAGDYAAGFVVAVVKADGTGTEAVVSRDASGNWAPSWSPDGSEIAFATTNSADIAVAKADGSGRRLLIQDATQDMAPSWSPDGTEIAFFRSFGFGVLYTMRSDGSGLRQLATVGATTDVPPAWSPTSDRLAFTGVQPIEYQRYGPAYREDVYVVGADRVGERRLTDTKATRGGLQPFWSPDGMRFGFLSWRTRTPEVFMMNPDGTCETEVTSSAGVNDAAWQPVAATAAQPLRCAAVSIAGDVDDARNAPALDASRIYVYRGTISNDGNVGSDALRITTGPDSPFTFVAAGASSGACTLGPEVVCTVPQLPPGGHADVTISFRGPASGVRELAVRVDGGGSIPDGDPSDNVDEIYRTYPFCGIATGTNGSNLHATAGPDLICGTVGPDHLFGGAGADRIFAGSGHDVVHGGAGLDEIWGGDGKNAPDTSDHLYGEGGDDLIHGELGNDVLIGGAGNDRLWGNFGGDFIHGGPGADEMFGGDGNDLIDSRDGLREHVYCGPGIDRAKADLRDVLDHCERVERKRAPQTFAPR